MSWIGAIVGGVAGALAAWRVALGIGASDPSVPAAISAPIGALVGSTWPRVLDVLGDVLFTPTDSF